MQPVGKLTPLAARVEDLKPIGKLVPTGTTPKATKTVEEDPTLKHLKLREGVKYESYKDTLKKLTGGVGHLLTKEEQALYPEGTPIPSEVVDRWLEQDVSRARKAASEQAKELGAGSDLEEALIHVNFQLGTKWNTIHKETWRLMKEGKYEEAAEEAADSKWYTQTPVRVEDFQNALRNSGNGS